MGPSQTSYKDRVSKLVGWGHWFTFACVFAGLLVSVKYLQVTPTHGSIAATLFLVSNWIGHISFLSFSVFVFVLFPLAFVVVWSPLYRLLAALVASTALTLLAVDSIFYSQFKQHLNIFTMELAFAESGKLLDLNTLTLVLTFVGIFTLLGIAGQKLWQKRKTTRVLQGAKICTWFFAICFFASHIIYIFADAFFYAPITSQRHVVPLSYPTTAKSFLSRYGLVDVEALQARRLEDNDDDNSSLAGYSHQSLTDLAVEHKPNILLFVIDSWRADALSEQNMPHLKGLTQEWQIEQRHYSGGNSRFEGVFSLLYGISPRYWTQVKRELNRPILMEQLEDLGYQLAWFSSQKEISDIEKATLLGSFDLVSMASQSKGIATNDRANISKWRDWVTQDPELSAPLLTVVELGSANAFATPAGYHNPFRPDLEGVYVFRDGASDDKEQLINRYRNAVHYIDSLMPEIFDVLHLPQFQKNTLVVITGSHGQELDDRNKGIWGDSSNHSDAQIRVPFLLFYSDQTAPVNALRMTSHYDLSATVLNLLYGDQVDPIAFSSGQDLLTAGGHDWLLIGGRDNFAIVEKSQTTEFDKLGKYKIYDPQYRRDRQAKIHITPLRGALKEATRFLSAEQQQANQD